MHTLAGMHSTTRVHTNVVDNTSVLNLELAKATETRTITQHNTPRLVNYVLPTYLVVIIIIDVYSRVSVLANK